ncbi:oxidoreductase, short chain dehydrogenase/reductase family protein [Ostertagia ostertagi]
MTIRSSALIACALAASLPVAMEARAQQTNEQLAARCAELGALYDRYNTRRSEGSGGPDMTRLGAGIDCQKGRYQQGIKALEDLLQRSRLEIAPQHDAGGIVERRAVELLLQFMRRRTPDQRALAARSREAAGPAGQLEGAAAADELIAGTVPFAPRRGTVARRERATARRAGLAAGLVDLGRQRATHTPGLLGAVIGLDEKRTSQAGRHDDLLLAGADDRAVCTDDREGIEGASRGIGAAMVRELRIGGLDVYAVARSADDLTELAQETGCRPLALDISHRDAVLHALGSLDADVLVNNASAPVRGGVSWETPPDDIDVLMDVNLRGTLNCLAAVVPGMKARGLGHIVNLGSTSGTAPLPGMPVYAMTKAAIHNLSQTLRLDLHGSGVRVSEISPGRVETGAHLGLMEDREEGRRRFYEGFETLQPGDIAEAVMFVLGAPQRMDVSFMEIVPTDQSYGGSQFHRRR